MSRADYHQLVPYLDPDEVHEDVVAVLDAIAAQYLKARPAR